MALPRTMKELSFAFGLNTKGDDRAQPEQFCDLATNVEFDDLGGLRCRFPFDGVRTNLVGGGTLTNARRLAMLGRELVCFTDTALYSWIPALSAWEYRADHLAIATDEQTVFATPGDQQYADRAEVAGHVVHCWWTAGDGVRFAVRDKTNNAVVQGPTTIHPSGSYVYQQPRVVALDTCVLLFFVEFVPMALCKLWVASITVNPYTYTMAASPVVLGTGLPATFHYDVCRIPGDDRCYAAVADAVGATYTIASVDASFAGATTTSAYVSASPNPIAIAVSPDAAYCTVINTPNDQVISDTWNVTAAGTPLTLVAGGIRLDTTTATRVGTISQVTAAYKLVVDSGQFRCYVFWSRAESDTVAGGVVFESCVNWIDAVSAEGVDVPFVYGLGIGARAFAHDSHVYVVGVFAGLSFSAGDPSGTYSELQNTYYLYRDDALLVGKAVWGEAGGFHAKGWLPNVMADASDDDEMVLMGGIRRVVPVGENTDLPNHAKNYAERAPREITFTFDDNRARRCVQFGETLYVLGSIILQYDGAQLVELGTCSYPWEIDITLGAAGAIAQPAGYSYKATDRWLNAKGELDRSTTATVAVEDLTVSNKIIVSTPNLYITRKTGVAIEVWRTKGNPPDGAPFFLVTSQDPSITTGDNAYVASDPTSSAMASVTDNLADADLAVLTANPENIGVLPALEPPPATIAYADNQRVFLAGIPGYPNTVYYSKYRQPGLVAAFSDALTFDVPTVGGAITAIYSLDGVLIVWCETATYQFAGAGFDDTGGGTNYQLARILSEDLGCIGHEDHAYFDGGHLVKTSKGWFVLDRSLNYEGNYVGAGPAIYDSEPVVSMSVLTARHQVRILTHIPSLPAFIGGGDPLPAVGRIMVYDTLVKQWSEFSVSDGVDMLLWGGTPAYLTETGVRAELALDEFWDGYDGSDYTLTEMDVETGWIKFGPMQARAIVDVVQLLGQYRSDCRVRVRLARDYKATAPLTWTYDTDKTWTPSPTVVGNSLQMKQGPRYRRCEALKARYTITAGDGVSPLAGPCVRMTSIAMLFALESNLYGAMAAAQKQ